MRLLKCLGILYLLAIVLFMTTSFELLTYDAVQVTMLDAKKAISLSKSPLLKKEGFIENQKYAFQIISKEKTEKGYLTEIVFEKAPKQDDFTMYCKKEKQSLWELIRKEWRLS